MTYNKISAVKFFFKKMLTVSKNAVSLHRNFT